MGTLPPSIATHIPLYGSRLLYDQGNPWKKNWLSKERFGRESGYVENVHEYHSSSCGSSRQRLWIEFKICKESSLENCGTASPETEKLVSGQTETAGKAWLISKIWCGCRQAYCTVELINIPLPKSTSSPNLYSVWERWETILLNPGRAKFIGIRTTIISKLWHKLMDNLWNSSGRFSPGRTTMGILNQIQQMMGEIVWTIELHRQDHLHVNV